jgi:hypothetical protein
MTRVPQAAVRDGEASEGADAHRRPIEPMTVASVRREVQENMPGMIGWEYKLVEPKMKVRVPIEVMEREFNRVGEEGPDGGPVR